MPVVGGRSGAFNLHFLLLALMAPYSSGTCQIVTHVSVLLCHCNVGMSLMALGVLGST